MTSKPKKRYIQLELSLFPEVIPTSTTQPLWHCLPNTWKGIDSLLYTDKGAFACVVEEKLRQYWKQAKGTDKTPCCAFLAVFKAMSVSNLDEAADVLKGGVHKKAITDFEKALRIARLAL